MPEEEIANAKAKNFKSSMAKLFNELKKYKYIIALALILASIGSILSIIAPNRLSDLTDEISKGLTVNVKNLTEISQNVSTNFTEENLNKVVGQVLSVDLSPNTVGKVLSDSSIKPNELEKFNNLLAKAKEPDFLFNLSTLSPDILKIILPTSKYENKTINTEDKINLIDTLGKISEQKFDEIDPTDNIRNILFPEMVIDKQKISSLDEMRFFIVMSSLKDKDDVNKLYEKIDEMPANVQKVVKPKMDIKQIKVIGIILVSLYLVSALFTYIEQLAMTIVSNKAAKDLRSKISHKINRLPLKFFDKHQAGDILSRVTNDVDLIAQTMNMSLANLVSAITLFVGSLIMMFYTNWIMAITAILSSLFGFVFMSIVLSKSQKYFRARQKELGNLNSHIEECYSGLNVIKAYNGKKMINEKFDELNEKVYDSNLKSQFLSGLMIPMMNFIGNFGYVAVCVVGALLSMNGKISFGVIVAFIMYVRLFTSPLSQIAQAMTSLQSTAAASERVFEFLAEEEMVSQKNLTKKLNKEEVKGNIEFDNVKFTYDGNDKPTIKNFSAKVKAGQKIAIVGPTGAGKTTMVNLLMKFYDIDSGDIKIDGISTKELTRENIHELFTMVLQDTWLFNGTVKENIVYNRKDIPDEEVKKVCKTVGIDHFIKTLSKGYNSILDDNDSISSGQKQLLTIARGMLEDAPFLILDEATSNVDTRTEELVQQAMDKLMEGRTSFIIAHRLSTIKNADLILVMKNGNIIEQGNHDNLMKQNGFYAELYNSQFEL